MRHIIKSNEKREQHGNATKQVFPQCSFVYSILLRILPLKRPCKPPFEYRYQQRKYAENCHTYRYLRPLGLYGKSSVEPYRRADDGKPSVLGEIQPKIFTKNNVLARGIDLIHIDKRGMAKRAFVLGVNSAFTCRALLQFGYTTLLL